ncbi:MAG TPA: tyrosinase family protein [Rhodopila sp.]|uniref:tyrosinase family protein n=1 Tax=Rhodopila sp. TaxID=2480087 RepID=UPI002CB72517|nr:tyrosinase family protein [Rhodopila sp.]HVY13613.1 tyrosinase family protein [Rhodopila sp.]
MGASTSAASATITSVRTRKNVKTLTGVNDDLFWYARAVEKLKQDALDQSSSWWYMAAVHGIPASQRQRTAEGLQATPEPSRQDVATFWNQCQHQTWYFLPWHRGYLACFEEVIAATVVSLGGPDGWALPYWNYSDATDSQARFLPKPFLDKNDQHGGINPLWVDGRNVANGQVELDVNTVNLDVLTETDYEGSAASGDPGFGGLSTGFHHGDTPGVNGGLEDTPHNHVHVDVGGWMGDPDTAAADPIFWLHHANIDRLWEVWVNRPGSTGNPTGANWRTGITFQVHGANNRVVSFTPGDMLDTSKVLHGYRYDDISDPFAQPAAGPSIAAMTPAPSPAAAHASMVAFSQPNIPITLGENATPIKFDPQAHATAMAAVPSVPGRPHRVMLHVEHMTGAGRSGSYQVFLRRRGETGQGVFAGMISTFGVAKATQPDSHAGGNGITSVLNITRPIELLRRDGWNGQDLEVTIRPTRSAEIAHAHPETRLNIGRLSIYYS